MGCRHGDSVDAPRCPESGSTLTGLPERICPECATRFTRRSLARAVRQRSRVSRWLTTAVVLLPLFYLPYIWLFEKHGSIIDWQSLATQYRGYWFRHYLVLPGMISELLTRRFYENETLLMSVYTLLIIGGSLWVASRGRKALIITAIFVALYGGWSFFATHAFYRM